MASLPYKGNIPSLGASPNSSFIDRSSWKKLAEIIKDYKPDIIQANSGDTLKYAVLSKLAYGWKTPLIIRNASEVGRYLNSAVQRSVNTYFYKHVDLIISVSKASEADFLKHFPMLKGKTKIIAVGLEEEVTVPDIILEPAQRKHIIHVGGFSFEKNHFGLLKIFEQVIKKDPGVHLHLIGDGELLSKVQFQVNEMQLKDHVTFYGFLNNPLPYIKAADVLILPSIIEGLPGVLLEAMFCKTAVIAYDVGGISEIINKKTGNLIIKNDEKAFAEKIVEVLNNSSQEKILTAYHMVLDLYMNKDLALDFSDTYERLLMRK